jgi:hypothetical protein
MWVTRETLAPPSAYCKENKMHGCELAKVPNRRAALASVEACSVEAYNGKMDHTGAVDVCCRHL